MHAPVFVAARVTSFRAAVPVGRCHLLSQKWRRLIDARVLSCVGRPDQASNDRITRPLPTLVEPSRNRLNLLILTERRRRCSRVVGIDGGDERDAALIAGQSHQRTGRRTVRRGGGGSRYHAAPTAIWRPRRSPRACWRRRRRGRRCRSPRSRAVCVQSLLGLPGGCVVFRPSRQPSCLGTMAFPLLQTDAEARDSLRPDTTRRLIARTTGNRRWRLLP